MGWKWRFQFEAQRKFVVTVKPKQVFSKKKWNTWNNCWNFLHSSTKMRKEQEMIKDKSKTKLEQMGGYSRWTERTAVLSRNMFSNQYMTTFMVKKKKGNMKFFKCFCNQCFLLMFCFYGTNCWCWFCNLSVEVQANSWHQLKETFCFVEFPVWAFILQLNCARQQIKGMLHVYNLQFFNQFCNEWL